MFGPCRAISRQVPRLGSGHLTSIRSLTPTLSYHNLKNGPQICRRKSYSTDSKSPRESSTNNPGNQTSPNVKRKPKANQTTRNTSLRRVAVEAERSRAAGRNEDGNNTKRAVLDTETKLVTAYCIAEQYQMADAYRALKGAGYILDPHHTGMYPQVLHIQLQPNNVGRDRQANQPHGDMFVFPSGTVVAWDVEEETVMALISKTLQPAAEKSHMDQMETEDLEFEENPESDTSRMIGDKIDLGTKLLSQPNTETVSTSKHSSTTQDHETDLVLTKIAFSSGLARSVKLAVLENALEAYVKSTRSIPTHLSQGLRLPFTRAFILRKTGELLSARAQLNLNSELTDALPDMFWDSRHELGLGGYFEQVGRALDVNVRSRVLNQKMTYAQEIVSVLRQQLSERHGHFLEWLIIALITIEVGFEILWLWRERPREDSDTTEAMLRTYLASVLEQIPATDNTQQHKREASNP